MKVLLLTKKTKYCQRVQRIVKKRFKKAIIIEGKRGQALPHIEKPSDYLISFLSPWIIPKNCLDKAKIAINFHPAPPKYPGTGCYNFALYHQEKNYGVTCHHMEEKVDRGQIIKVIRFPINKVETVLQLKQKSMRYLVKLFKKIWQDIILKKSLPQSKEKWLCKPYTRKDLQALCKIKKNITRKEVNLRIKATYYPGAENLPFINLYGKKFIFKPENKNELKKS